ncbi:MAG: hypothetical protein WBA29_16925 [Xanthobacteraceae bacterium]
MEDGEAVALPGGQEHGPKAAIGRDGRYWIPFSLPSSTRLRRDMKKAGPLGPAAVC